MWQKLRIFYILFENSISVTCTVLESIYIIKKDNETGKKDKKPKKKKKKQFYKSLTLVVAHVAITEK